MDNKEKISALYPVSLNKSEGINTPVAYYETPNFPYSSILRFNCILFNVIPDKGYVTDFKIYNVHDQSKPIIHFSSKVKVLKATLLDRFSFGDLASSIQQFETPLITINEYRNNFRLDMELYEHNSKLDTAGKLLDSATTYLSLKPGGIDNVE